MNELLISPFQQRVLEIPEEIDVFLGGGRGGSKSFLLALLALRHVEQYGSRARILYIRRSYKGLADFELICRELFSKVYGADARYNAAEHVWRFPNGGYLELAQLDSHEAYASKQGRSFTLLLIDEAGQYSTPDLLDLLRSNLRGGKDIPIRAVMAANPGGAGHYWLARRYVFKAKPWEMFFEEKSKRNWVCAPSTYRDNPYISQEQYRGQLESSCPDDAELLSAWLDGNWAIARGAYFASVLEESRVAVGPFSTFPTYSHPGVSEPWTNYIATDFGSAAPSVTYLFAKSPGAEFEGQFYPRNSIIAIDEYAVYRRDNLNMAFGWTAAKTAEALLDFCKGWGVPASGVADDACFSKHGHGAGSIADEFAHAGVSFQPAKKADRITGWQLMKRLFADAGKPDVPGLYVSRSCEYFWATVPYLARDQKRIEDLDSSGPDHGADAMRYGLLREQWAMTLDMKIAQ